MEKKIRSIYEIGFSEIISWDEENDFPGDMNPIISVDGEDPSFITASITEAYRFYREHKDDLADDEYCELTAREIEISDKEWTELINKGKLDYSDYSKYETKANFRGLAWNFSYKGKTDSDDSTLEELLIVQSENFNMRVICERAGISYSTYRGFKNNKQPFSRQKIYELLRTMKAIGSECWDEDLEDAYKINKSIVEKYHLDQSGMKSSFYGIVILRRICYNIMDKKSIYMERGKRKMKFNYNGLWKTLIDKNMKKKDLIDKTGVSPTTISKMVRGDAVSLTIIGKICEELGTDIGDLICIEKNSLEDK